MELFSDLKSKKFNEKKVLETLRKEFNERVIEDAQFDKYDIDDFAEYLWEEASSNEGDEIIYHIEIRSGITNSRRVDYWDPPELTEYIEWYDSQISGD